MVGMGIGKVFRAHFLNTLQECRNRLRNVVWDKRETDLAQRGGQAATEIGSTGASGTHFQTIGSGQEGQATTYATRQARHEKFANAHVICVYE